MNIRADEKKICCAASEKESPMDIPKTFAQFMTAKEVAKDFFMNKFSYQKVLRLTRNGILPAVRAGKSYLFERAALERWAEMNFNRPAYARPRFS